MDLPIWLKTTSANASQIWLILAFIIVTGLGFEAGLLQGQTKEIKPLVVTVPNDPGKPIISTRPLPAGTSSLGNEASGINLPESTHQCAYVGSKNSNKYHLPTSRCAKQIKPANQICFESVEAAVAKGYLAGCLD